VKDYWKESASKENRDALRGMLTYEAILTSTTRRC
jgi:hypothetical protein